MSLEALALSTPLLMQQPVTGVASPQGAWHWPLESHVLLPVHVPHWPPQPSGPHSFPVQFGTQLPAPTQARRWWPEGSAAPSLGPQA